MPTQVQNRPPSSLDVPGPHHTTVHPATTTDPYHPHTSMQHREALRLALGSILSPKRPSPSRSLSGSGAATPGYFSSHSPSPAPPTSAHHHHLPLPAGQHPHHAPSPLGQALQEADAKAHLGTALAGTRSGAHTPIPGSTAHSSKEGSPVHSPVGLPPATEPGPAAVPAVEVHAPSPVVPGAPAPGGGAAGGSTHGSGAGTPMSKFVETLQGKSAWDALIHGSFS